MPLTLRTMLLLFMLNLDVCNQAKGALK